MSQTIENNKEKEKYKNKQNENQNMYIQRNEDKKSTLNLSEIPNIINLETQINGKSKNFSPLFADDNHSLANGLLNLSKLKNSFINEPISHNKDESRSSLEEIQILLKNTINENKNMSVGKKEKRQKINSKTKKNSKEKKIINKEEKEEIINYKIKRKHQSTKKKPINIFSDKEQRQESKKKVTVKYRNSEIIRRFKKDGLIVEEDEGKRKTKRKSLFSQHPFYPYNPDNNDIFNKFFARKNSLETKDEKRNEDKIYVNIENKKELVIVNTTQETVKNYYDYMKDCFELIYLNFNKGIKLQTAEPVNFHFKKNKKLVIFELENTLVSSLGENFLNEINNNKGINIRPHLKSSLDLIKKDYNIVIYSSSKKDYVDKILDFLDPEHNYFNYRLYREHCFKFIIDNKIYFTKNLNIFKNIYDLKDIIIVDCSVLGFGFFLDNGIPIIPFFDSKEDVELKMLSFYLVSISSNYDLREALKRDMKLDDYLEEAKKNNEKRQYINIEKSEEKVKMKKQKELKEFQENKIKSANASPEDVKRKMKKENKTFKVNNYIHIFKGSSDSDEDKKSIDNKHKIHDKTKKSKKDKDKDKDKDKFRPRKDRYFSTKLIKKKNRKYTVNELNRNNIDFNIKSPKKTSPEKSVKYSTKKNYDKNKE